MVDSIVSAVSLVSQATAVLHPMGLILVVGTKAYETVRDYQRMADCVEREVATKTAANLSLASNVIGLASSAATFGASMHCRGGKSLSLTTQMSIQGINGAAAVINCTKVINSTYDIFTRYFLNEEKLEFGDIARLGSSLLLFTNSINNMSIVARLGDVNGNELRGLITTKVKTSLSLIAKKSLELFGSGSNDLLRLANDIAHGDVLGGVQQVCKNLGSAGFLATSSALGIALEVVPGIAVRAGEDTITRLDTDQLSQWSGQKFVEHIGSRQNLIDILNTMGRYCPVSVVKLLLDQARQFIENGMDSVCEEQNIFLTTEWIVFKIFSHVVTKYSDITYEYLGNKRGDLMQGVTEYFHAFNSTPSRSNESRRNCDVCGSYYYTSSLS